MPWLLHCLFACTDNLPEDTAPHDPAQSAAVIATVAQDYSVGSLAEVTLSDWTVSDSLATTSGDPAVVTDDDKVLQINRFGYDNLRIYAPGDYTAPELEVSMGDALDTPTNPHDAAICGGALFVSLYERDHLRVLDPASGLLLGTVSLADHADADGVPEASTIIEADGRLLVGLQRLEREAGWIDAGGKVVEIDCDSRSVTRSWDTGGNAAVHPWADGAVLVSSRAFGDHPGGIEILNLDTGALESIGTLDGTLTGVAAHDDAALAVTLSDDWATYGLYCLDLVDGTVTEAQITEQFVTTVAANALGQAWVGLHQGWVEPDEMDPHIAIWDIASCTRVGEVALSLAPYSLAFR